MALDVVVLVDSVVGVVEILELVVLEIDADEVLDVEELLEDELSDVDANDVLDAEVVLEAGVDEELDPAVVEEVTELDCVEPNVVDVELPIICLDVVVVVVVVEDIEKVVDEDDGLAGSQSTVSVRPSPEELERLFLTPFR